MNPKISVVYCTARRGGLDILVESMKVQTFRDFEVIIVDELRRAPETWEGLNLQHGLDIRFVEPPPKKPSMFWNLSASLNAGVRASRGEIIVLLQDYIWVKPDGLQRFKDFIVNHGDCLVSGVGHQYKEPSHVDNPLGLYSCWTSFPGSPAGDRTFTDPRIKGLGSYLCNPVEWEANYSAFSRAIWSVVGGFDEDFDAGWGYDNVNFAERAQLAGMNTFIDMENECLCYSHIELFGEKEHRDKSPNNQALWHWKYRGMRKGGEPWRLNYA